MLSYVDVEKSSTLIRSHGILPQRLRPLAWLIAGAGLVLASFYLPYWNLLLKAPQYPHGLRISVYLNHVTGDTREVNLLNHYIGMGKLESAAPLEKKFAWDALALLALSALIAIPLVYKHHRLLFIPPLLFYFGFLGDLYYWLHRSGHTLNPEAPVHIKPFTPALFGSGKIGQFVTHAHLGSGFWILTLGFVFLLRAGFIFGGASNEASKKAL